VQLLPTTTTVTSFLCSGALEVDATSEVVGGYGRVGSLFLRENGAIAVPRGIAPGCLTRSNTNCNNNTSVPIIVAVQSNEWKRVFDSTPPHRQSDLVWVGNGILSQSQSQSQSWQQQQRTATVVIPHFGVLKVGADPVTSPESPLTYVFGKHAITTAAVLTKRGVKVSILESWQDMCYLAARKVLWASCLWLLSHDTGSAAAVTTTTADSPPDTTRPIPPLTFKEVHETKQEELERLVKELLPAFRVLTAQSNTESDTESTASVTTPIESEQDILAYMKEYSLSMPHAIPSKAIAMVELYERNGIWFTTDQSFHLELLERVTGYEAVADLQKQQRAQQQTAATDQNTSTITSESTTKMKLVPIPAIDLVCCGQETNSTTNGGDDREIQSAIVVGGGIIGSSIARALVQRCGKMKVTVYDPTPTGKTTSASWAWLNANQKPPHAYKSLNQLGLRGWRSDSLLASLPSWNGTVVRTKEKLELNGGYTAEGPLNTKRIREIEPQAKFGNAGHVYYFADEGHVNPHEAVLALRQEANDNGVLFVSDERVIGLVRDDKDNRVVGVKVTSSSRDDARGTTKEKLADVVIVAAGANSSDKSLGGVPLVHNPSRTYFATPCSSSSSGSSNSKSSSPASAVLSRTLMDTIEQLYVAQRKDGTFVVGGGALKFGLSATSPSIELSPEEVRKQMTEAQKLAQTLAPRPIENSKFTHKEEAIKPMPKDGFPILGYLETGLYSAVTHSGMTMAPLVGQLVAAEVKERVSLSILDDYRVARFDK